MKNFGLCASILAVSNIVAFSTPAFAQPTAPRPGEDKVGEETAKPDADKKPVEDKNPPVQSDDANVALHVESPVPVSVERRAPGGGTWENVCTTPCDVKSSSVAEYRIVGEGLNESKPFMIDGTKEKVNIYVAPGSTSRANTGLYILVAGGLITIAGVAVIFLASDKHGVFTSDGQTHPAHLNAIFFGGALVMAGVATGLFGAGWMIGNKHSDVSGDVAKVIDEKPAPGSSPSTPGGSAEVKFSTSNRQPTWNTQKNPGLPQVMTIPVLTGSF